MASLKAFHGNELPLYEKTTYQSFQAVVYELHKSPIYCVVAFFQTLNIRQVCHRARKIR